MQSIADFFKSFGAVEAAFIATLFTWGMTALGASTVLFFKTMNRRFFDVMLGFTGGVMLAASFFSLLVPAIDMSEGEGFAKVMPSVLGFGLGSLFLYALDKYVPHLHIHQDSSEAEGMKTKMSSSKLLVLAITIHNIPEGLAVGVLFGGAYLQESPAMLMSAIALAIGIGIQNFPEGIAVALPLRREGLSRFKSFNYGQLSAIVEPIFGIIGALLVVQMSAILPYTLAFAAGAMIYVTVEEVIPEFTQGKFADGSTLGFLFGFMVMMSLDVALG